MIVAKGSLLKIVRTHVTVAGWRTGNILSAPVNSIIICLTEFTEHKDDHVQGNCYLLGMLDGEIFSGLLFDYEFTVIE